MRNLTALVSAFLLSACSTIYPTKKGVVSAAADISASLEYMLKDSCYQYSIYKDGFMCVPHPEDGCNPPLDPDYGTYLKLSPAPVTVKFSDIEGVYITQYPLGGGVFVDRKRIPFSFRIYSYLGTEPPKEAVDGMDAIEFLRKKE